MKVSISKDGKTLTIEMPVADVPAVSKSGKTLVVVSSHGNQKTDVLIQGKPLTIGVNGYISK